VPENQTQPNNGGDYGNPGGEPRLTPQPDPAPGEAGPSDAEIAHQPNEGPSHRQAWRQQPPERDSQADDNRGTWPDRR
jgi:hypothetical protein